VSREARGTAGWWRGGMRWVVVSIVFVAVLALGAGLAEAGSYTAWYCRDGAHRGIGFRDWAQEISGVGYVATTTVACPVGGDGGSFGPHVAGLWQRPKPGQRRLLDHGAARRPL
jgi:hypothetical protein